MQNCEGAVMIEVKVCFIAVGTECDVAWRNGGLVRCRSRMTEALQEGTFALDGRFDRWAFCKKGLLGGEFRKRGELL